MFARAGGVPAHNVAIAGSAIDCGAAIQNTPAVIRRRSTSPMVLWRRSSRGAFEDSFILRHRPQFELRLQGQVT